MPEPKVIFWFRRDLRLNDNHGLYKALLSGYKVLPVFIFDTNILKKLPADDKRIPFIHHHLVAVHEKLKPQSCGIKVLHGDPVSVIQSLTDNYQIHSVYANHDYEPYALARDKQVEEMLKSRGISFHTFKDQVLFEKNEVVKSDSTPYVVFTPFSRLWLQKMEVEGIPDFPSELHTGQYLSGKFDDLPKLSDLGFTDSPLKISESGPLIDAGILQDYAENRNFPAFEKTTKLGTHLRFGTISVRDCIKAGKKYSAAWLNELIWREFFMQILWHFPYVEKSAFRPEYNRIVWNNNPDDFEKWCRGKTGYPMVDAGMRELEATGFMHNRVRMVVAGFLTKHLLIDWKWGEAWFAEKLLDYELSSNNGNWQWAAGTGCDAAPYFRIFNPTEQLKKFDANLIYVKRWIPEYGTAQYPEPIIEHSYARKRCLSVYSHYLKP
ncbi:MAG: DNA photolyase family protein [Lentimicrobium sp.]|nr:DNA photolyase family protein [Lentimicrobium sp.]